MASEEQPLLSDGRVLEENQYGSSRMGGSNSLDAKKTANDPEAWSKAYKWTVVSLLSLMAFNVSFTCSSILPIAGNIVSDLDDNDENSNKSVGVLLVTVWEFGEAAGPLLLAPLSELYGRRAVMNSANAAFILATILTALCETTPLFVTARFLTGLTVASNVLNPAIVGDMLAPEQRGSAMTIVMMATLVGGAAGPAVGGVVAEIFGWRPVVWTSVALAGASQLLLIVLLKETYRFRVHGETVLDSDVSLAHHGCMPRLRSLWHSLTRPAQVLYHSGVLKVLCLFHGMAFSYYYIVVVTLPDILYNVYDQTPSEAGLSFIYFTAGTGIGVVICVLAIDRLYTKLRDRNNGIGQPEFYLPLALVSAVGQPASVILYGWVAHVQLPLPYFLFTLVLLGIALLLSSLPVFAYVVEAFGMYSASAVAAIIVTRCVMGALVPLLVWPLVGILGRGWAFAVLGAAGICLAPVPMLLMTHGSSWRQQSKYTKSQAHAPGYQDLIIY